MTSFDIGTIGSASQVMSAFESLRQQGQGMMDALVQYRLSSMVDFEQKVESLNSRRQKANRIRAPFTAVKFVVSDFFDIDQTLSSVTIRADAQAVTLKERPIETRALVQTQTFSTSSGTAESISDSQDIYRVLVTDGSVPTGTFHLRLADPLEMAVLTFDLAAMPPTPAFSVSVSADGTSYTDALETSMNGYRLTAWLPLTKIQYIKLSITPSAPDILSGNTYTFGLTDFVGSETEFQTLSEIVSIPQQIAPTGSQLLLAAPSVPGVVYFLSFNAGPWQEYKAGDAVAIPGTQVFNQTDVTVVQVGNQYLIGDALPADAYPSSVKVIDQGTGDRVRLAHGLSGVLAGAPILTRDYVAVTPGAALNYLAASGAGFAPLSKQFTVSYVTGPAAITVQIKVQLSTSDRTVTPTFTGASLEEM